MSFCGECGAKIANESAKFCNACGVSLVITANEETVVKEDKKDTNRPVMDKNPGGRSVEVASVVLETSKESPNAYRLGAKLEEAVEKILKAQGYVTIRDQRLSGPKGKSEIDIVATKISKGYKDEIFVECKNFSFPVPQKEVRDFESKMRDLGKKNGLFVAVPDFSRDAEEWGQKLGLQLWNWEDIRDKIAEIEIGRLGASEKQKIPHSLPLKIDYDQATSLNVENKEKVEIESCKLIWKPFYKVSYKLKFTRTDPRKEKLVREDSGYYLIDGLSGTILEKSKLTKNLLNKVLGQSKESSLKTKENDIFIKELEQESDSGEESGQSEKYKKVILNAQIQPDQVKKRVMVAIVEDHTEDISYTLKRDEDNLFAEERYFTIQPHFSEINITSIKLIYCSKWEVEFQSKEFGYTKKMSGNSGTVIYDTISNCNKHWNVNIMGLGVKKNVAACDVCGEVLCKDHIRKCSTCGSWRCETHSEACISCQKSFCPEHITIKCAECNEDVCETCVGKCPLCGESHCKSHMTKCSKCQKIVCTSCTRKVGGIMSIGQKTICKSC